MSDEQEGDIPVLVWINPWGSRYRAAAGPLGSWSLRSRLLMVAGALAATLPAWPGIQPGEPVADEMLSPAEVAVIVPVALAFPVAWTLLGRSGRMGRWVGVLLVGCVFAWSMVTTRLASYATPPSVDDVLRWYLVVTGVVVGAAAAREWYQAARRGPLRWMVGVVVWVVGWGATVAVPVVDGQMMPPSDAVLPLPPTMTVVDQVATCAPRREGGRYCLRRFTIAATDGAQIQDLARRLGQHLERAKGWRAAWYEFTPEPDLECRPVGWLANPYRLCADLRVDPLKSTMEVQLAYANPHDPIYD